MSAADRARAAVLAIKEQGLHRAIPSHDDDLIDFASNDYLGLSADATILQALRGAQIVGSGGSRLLSGSHPEHAALESDLARWLNRERALLFSSGYLAALGAIHAGAQLVTSAYSDTDNHASLIDALRLTKLDRHVFTRESVARKREGNTPALIVSESVFGTSGRRANVASLVEHLRPDDLLLLDEAHALGVCGARGSGLASGHNDERIVVLGTLSKALGCAGGFIAGPADFIELAINTARTFLFDTSLPPPIARAAHAGLRAVARGDALRARLRANVAHALTGLRRIGASPNLQAAPIIPLIVGDAQKAVELAAHLRAQGIYAPALRPPTVPAGTSRLRLVVRADHTPAQIDQLVSALAQGFQTRPHLLPPS